MNNLTPQTLRSLAVKAFELLFLIPYLRQSGNRHIAVPDVAVDFPAAVGLFLPDLQGLTSILHWGVHVGYCDVGGIGAADDGRVALNIDLQDGTGVTS